MGLILLEALLALVLLVGIVWWTMFSGRQRGELKQPSSGDTPPGPPQDAAQGPPPAPLPPPSSPPSPPAPSP